MFKFPVAANGGGAVREGKNSGVKCSSETIIAKSPNGDEGFVGNNREDVCLAGCQRHAQKRKKGDMGGTHGGTIGETDEDLMSGGDKIGTGSCGAKEMATVARVGNGAMGIDGIYPFYVTTK